MTMIDDPELADLERRLREACRATIPRLMEREASGPVGVAPFESDTFDLIRGERPPSGHRWLAAAAATVLVVGAVFLLARSMDTDRAAAPGAPAEPDQPDQPTATTYVLTCGAEGCPEPDPLPVAPGTTDYYAHAGGLGSPTLLGHHFEDLTWCVQLSADGTVCEQVEGAAGVPLVAYEVDDGTVEIGTTFASITPEDYAREWGPTSAGGDGPTEAVTVRGHHAIRYMNEDRPAVVWNERPDVLAWVAVSPDLEDRLLEIAEHVQAVAGPSTIPHRVSAPDLRLLWTAENNGAPSLLVIVVDGQECVGFGQWASCDRFAITNGDGAVLVGGSTPPEYSEVRVSYDGGEIVAGTVGFAPYASRFFLVEIPTSDGLTVEWIGDPADTILDATTTTVLFDLTEHPQVSPPSVDGGVTEPTLWTLTTTTTLPPGVSAPRNEGLLTTGAPPPTTAPPPDQTTTTTTLPARA